MRSQSCETSFLDVVPIGIPTGRVAVQRSVGVAGDLPGAAMGVHYGREPGQSLDGDTDACLAGLGIFRRGRVPYRTSGDETGRARLGCDLGLHHELVVG